MLNQSDFFEKLHIKKRDWKISKLKWSDMRFIYEDFSSYRDNLNPFETEIVEILKKEPNVHAVKSRIKDPEHLIEKIIRKTIADKKAWVTRNNYRRVVPDLIGVRVLHLFREDWVNIHDYICEKLKACIKPVPEANVRYDEPQRIVELYKNKKCKIKPVESGYTSVHYIKSVKFDGNKKCNAEIQVRTLFEEAWSEISHSVRYPYNLENEHITRLTKSTSAIACQLDEFSSVARYMGELFELIDKNAGGINDDMINEKAAQIQEISSWISKRPDSVVSILLKEGVLKLNFNLK